MDRAEKKYYEFLNEIDLSYSSFENEITEDIENQFLMMLMILNRENRLAKIKIRTKCRFKKFAKWFKKMDLDEDALIALLPKLIEDEIKPDLRNTYKSLLLEELDKLPASNYDNVTHMICKDDVIRLGL